MHATGLDRSMADFFMRDAMETEAMPASLPIATTSEASASRTTMKWWQWFLVYPTVGLALVSALPTWAGLVQSFQIGVPFGQVSEAQGQDRLWGKNFECASRQEIQWIKTPRNIQIGARVCPSGDVLVLAKRPESEEMTFRWVSAEVLERRALSLLGLTAAYASSREVTGPQGGYNVMSQRWLKPAAQAACPAVRWRLPDLLIIAILAPWCDAHGQVQRRL